MSKPSKPTPDFPLFPHASGQWAKKIKGKLIYFGPWADPEAAFARYRGRMSTPKSIASTKKAAKGANGSRPAKPHPDYPLYAHASGQWAKRVRNKVHYFGPWADPDAALAKWLKEKDDLLAGREPETGDGLTVGRLCNLFLESKKRLVESGELAQRSWDDYHKICDRVQRVLGPGRQVANLHPADFEKLRADFAKSHGPVALYGDIGRVRVVFNHAVKQGFIEVPVKYGDGFDKPSRAVLRRARQEKPRRMFQAGEIRRIIDAAGIQLRAMIYLGINCGFGNNDCAKLPTTALNLEKGWIDFGRPKTGIHRRCPLWPETVAAVRAALDNRPTPKDEADKDRVFITKYGTPWEPKSHTDNPVSKEMAKVLKALGIHRKGVGFYALRHTFQTIGEKSRDKDAVRAIMGHVEGVNDMSAVYNEEPVEDSRLRAVADFVRAWVSPAK
jgi:integrase